MDLLVPGLDMRAMMMVRLRPVKCAAIAAALRSHTYSQYSRIPKPSPIGLYSTSDGIPLTQVPVSHLKPAGEHTRELPNVVSGYLPAWNDSPDHNRRSMAGDTGSRKCKGTPVKLAGLYFRKIENKKTRRWFRWRLHKTDGGRLGPRVRQLCQLPVTVAAVSHQLDRKSCTKSRDSGWFTSRM